METQTVPVKHHGKPLWWCPLLRKVDHYHVDVELETESLDSTDDQGHVVVRLAADSAEMCYERTAVEPVWNLWVSLWQTRKAGAL